MSQRKQFYSIFALVFTGILLFRAAGLLTDYLWFKSLNYEKIFLVNFEAQILIFFISAIICFLAITFNLYLSYKFRKASGLKNIFNFKTKIFVAILVSYIIGSSTSSNWLTILQYFRQSSFNVIDPIFGLDASFYVFSLPYFQILIRYAFSVLIITLIFVIIDYFQTLLSSVVKPALKDGQTVQINLMDEVSKLKKRAIVHIAFLLSSFFILLAVSHSIGKYSIMYSVKGIVVGAGYADIAAYLPAIKILMFTALFVAVFVFVYLAKSGMKKRMILAYVVAGYLVVSFVGLAVIPNLVQSFRVSPNELNLEKPYIENNIKFTRIAYGLDDVQATDFRADQKVTKEIIENSAETVDNIRILDWRPLTDTYKQTQEIRLYYDLSGVDVDRYTIEDKYTQVMLAPREMDQSSLNSKTWVNIHQVYTHGYGVVMSPVNSVTEQGLPNYIIQDIPPVYNVDEESIIIDNPRIYYGEKDNAYVFVNTDADEFDFPKGELNEYTNYEGQGGIKLDTFGKKLLMALRFADIKILLSSDINEDSKIMYDRAIKQRIYKLTPFLTLDNDPYLVISDGELFWIQDAYTTTGNFPYSQKYNNINYIRNPVKIVVDAYNGDVSYYVIDPDEPIMKSYSNIFFEQFKSFDEMSEDLKKHIRYPEDMFRIQSEIYNTYHMDDATVFYNKEDAWQLPMETYGTGQQVTVDPYFNILKLPGEAEEEFVLMISFTPTKKDNMVAWLAARSDGENYGKLLLYRFPKDKLVYGPSQIEARIDQDSEISQQLTLWSQQGSRVTRGNLLVIPIENSLLYVEPLYIQAENGQLPELKRVLVSDGDKVVMEQNLGKALEALLGERINQPNINVTGNNLAEQANNYYEKILESMEDKDWSGIGNNLDRLGEILNAMIK